MTKLGRQSPAQSVVLPYTRTKGQQAVKLYELTGRKIQEWQQLLLYDIMSYNDDGLWVHVKFGYSLPRRNGKSEILAIRELWGLVMGEHIMHTAHRTTTTHAAWEKLCGWLDTMGLPYSSIYFPGANGQKSYNLLHLNAMYDIQSHLYVDAIIQGKREINESGACVEMIDRSKINKALVITDRGYEGYNLMAHCQEKGWYFLIRVKDGINGIKHGLSLPDEETFDVPMTLYLTRKQTNETKELIKSHPSFKRIPSKTVFDYLPKTNKAKEPALFYPLHFRIVRFKLTEESYETVVTNLEPTQYPSDVLKGLYAMRWGIETSFRTLKYTLGLLQFHSKKVMCILQEIYAHLTLYNFVEMITSHVVIKKRQRQYTYKANFSTAVHICRLFYKGKITSPKVEALIADCLTPIRPGRNSPRNQSQLRSSYSFVYSHKLSQFVKRADEGLSICVGKNNSRIKKTTF